MARKLTIDIHDLQDLPYSCLLVVKPIGVRIHTPYVAAVEKTYTIDNGQLPDDATILPGRYVFRFVAQHRTLEQWEADVAESTDDVSVNDLYNTRFAHTESFAGVTVCRGDDASLLGSGSAPAGRSLLSNGQGRTYWGEIADIYLTEDEMISALSQYYTQLEIAALLAMKSNMGHDHDGRYFTRDEVNELLDGKADVLHAHAIADVTGLTSALSGKADLIGGVIPSAQLPAIAITDVYTVATQSEMVALTAQRGDVAIRMDVEKTFILSADNASILDNWKELPVPLAGVVSVNGQTGVVVLNYVDVGAAAGEHSHANATTSVSGFMSSSDKTKIDDAMTLANAQTVIGVKTFAAEILPALIRYYGTVGASLLTGYAQGYGPDEAGRFGLKLWSVGNSASKQNGIEIVNNVPGNGEDYVKLVVFNKPVAQCNSGRYGGDSDFPDFFVQNKMLIEKSAVWAAAGQASLQIQIPDWQSGDALKITSGAGASTTNARITNIGEAHFPALRITTSNPPASAVAPGNAGQFAWDASYLYICTATNTWRRVAHNTW